MNKYILARKGIHLFAFIIPFSYYLFFSKSQFVVVITSLTIIASIIEIIRFKNIKAGSLFYKAIGKMLWERETKTITGATTFIISAFLCTLLFSKPVVVTGLLFLTFSDTSAYLIGSKGRVKIMGKKTLEGGIAFLLTAIVICLLMKQEIKLLASLIGACVACIVELLPWKIDDNFSIPIISCLIMQLLFYA
ncbi:MAG: hypothetical protein HY769_06130 [Candidatus Stahlbacteria bacterium]|nr:hypothetical protein [Candidatus Stahlbacteria bacterium]